MPEKKRAKRAPVKRADAERRQRRMRPVVPLIVLGLVIVAVGALIGYGYLAASAGTVYTEDATIQAPLVPVLPAAPGPLDRVFIAQGDPVRKGAIVAYVNGAPVVSPATGRVVSVVDTVGSTVGPTDPVAQIIDPEQMRVVAQVKETKGLSRLAVGDPVTFTVDAFGDRRFNGTVSEIAQTAASTSQVFSISTTRPTQIYDVKIAFDAYANPEILNGMSAKVWIRT